MANSSTPNPINSPVSARAPAISKKYSIKHTLPPIPCAEAIYAAGPGPRGLVLGSNTVTHYLGLDGKKEIKIGI